MDVALGIEVSPAAALDAASRFRVSGHCSKPTRSPPSVEANSYIRIPEWHVDQLVIPLCQINQ
jgi:hypothetical protein